MVIWQPSTVRALTTTLYLELIVLCMVPDMPNVRLRRLVARAKPEVRLLLQKQPARVKGLNPSFAKLVLTIWCVRVVQLVLPRLLFAN